MAVTTTRFMTGANNRGKKSIERKKTSVQCPLGRNQFNVNIATEMELVYDTTADGFHTVKRLQIWKC